MDGLNQIIVFELKNELYGISITQVKEIIKTVTVSRLPKVPEYVEGIANLRGKIHIIYNISTKLGLDKKEMDEDTRIIVINSKNAAFIVDAVHEIIHVEMKDIDTLAEFPDGIGKNYITGIVRNGENLIIVLNLDEVLSHEE